jgi:phosphate transport system substrate-binding protein
MSDEQLGQAKTPILHFPTVLGAVVATFNLPGVEKLRLTPETLTGIFLGKITSWNDPALAKDNPGVALPTQAIVPVHRSDGSGTTYVFVDFLSKVSPEWAKTVGKNTAVSWPVGLGGKGNEGVTGLIKQTPNSIGYVELVYAVQNKLPYAEIKNRAGNFVSPSLESVTAAAAGRVGEDARGLPRFNHRSERSRRVSDRQLHLAPRPESHRRRRQGQGDHRLPRLDAGGGSGVHEAARLRTAS